MQVGLVVWEDLGGLGGLVVLAGLVALAASATVVPAGRRKRDLARALRQRQEQALEQLSQREQFKQLAAASPSTRHQVLPFRVSAGANVASLDLVLPSARPAEELSDRPGKAPTAETS